MVKIHRHGKPPATKAPHQRSSHPASSAAPGGLLGTTEFHRELPARGDPNILAAGAVDREII